MTEYATCPRFWNVLGDALPLDALYPGAADPRARFCAANPDATTHRTTWSPWSCDATPCAAPADAVAAPADVMVAAADLLGGFGDVFAGDAVAAGDAVPDAVADDAMADDAMAAPPKPRPRGGTAAPSVAAPPDDAVVVAPPPPSPATPPALFQPRHERARQTCNNPAPEGTYVRRLPGAAIPYDAASSVCAARGGRLCTKDEAYTGCVGMFSGLNYDKELLATSTRCTTADGGDGVVHTRGWGDSNDPNRRAETTCRPKTHRSHVQCCYSQPR
jgi:hypothetical protein